MKIQKLTATKVNGYIDLDITFDSSLNFLIGINGSGKTSALKLILGLLKPSFQHLNQIDFEAAEINILVDDKPYRIYSKKIEKSQFMIGLDPPEREPIFSQFQKVSEQDFPSIASESYNEAFEKFKAEFHSSISFKEIQNLNTPLFLGLNRKLTTPSFEYYRDISVRRKYRHYESMDAINASLGEVQELIFDYYRTITRQQTKIISEFKNKVFENYFEFIEDTKSTSPEDVKSLAVKKEEVQKAITGMNITNLNSKVDSYFELMEKTLKEIQKQSSNSNTNFKIDSKARKLYNKWFLNIPQLTRINQVLELSSEYLRQLSVLNQPVEKLEQILIKFFKETGKTIAIRGDGQFMVKLPNDLVSNIFQLSSGEKQILIMIAHLIFTKDEHSGGVFIVDEPELSLHISWQMIFVESILEASPKTQFILATHSPSIIGHIENEKFCLDLSKSYEQ